MTENKEKKKIYNVKFYAFKDNGSCLADATLPFTGRVIRGIKLREVNGRVTCEMPDSLVDKWHFKDLKWEYVETQLIQIYLKNKKASRPDTSPVQKHQKKNKEQISKNNKTDEEPKVIFSEPAKELSAVAEVYLQGIKTSLKDIFVETSHTDEGIAVLVSQPKIFDRIKNYSREEWKKTEEAVRLEFRRQILNESSEPAEEVTVTFSTAEEILVCYATLKLSEAQGSVEGIRIKRFTNGKLEVIPPAFFDSYRLKSPWSVYRSLILAQLQNQAVFPGDEIKITEKKKLKTEKLYYGRIKNAAHSDFLYYPHSVLRPDTAIIEGNEKKSLSLLATALSKGTGSGIGPFEINALWWISKLRYVTSTMLIELAAHGFISLGWRESVSLNKLAVSTRRMCEYDMIVRSQFCCLDENGNVDNTAKSVSRIMTLAPNGSILLKELGKDANRYNPFTVLQDGNTVKRYLVSNQWLIYWLKTYKERIGENYNSAELLLRKGEEFTVARIYAQVTIDNTTTLVAEPIRRVGEFEKAENKRWLTDKLERIVNMFDNPDQLYISDQKVTYSSRPIITLLCEDDEHIKEVTEMLSELMEKNPEQEFWFTTDLRVFNMDYMGKRFFKLNNNELEIIDLAAYFGCDEEAEKEALLQKFLPENSFDSEQEALIDEIDGEDFSDFASESEEDDDNVDDLLSESL